jgi:hypothetical protein
MQLLRDFVFPDFFLLGRLRALAAARRPDRQRAYTITVPAPLASEAGNVVALRRPLSDGAGRRGIAPAAPALPLLARVAHQ